MLPIVFHPSYTVQLASQYRFPMAKFGRIFEHLVSEGIVTTEAAIKPVPVPREWLELVHSPSYVSKVFGHCRESEAVRQIGLPLSTPLVYRSRLAVAGTIRAGRLALDCSIACNIAGGSHHAFRDHGSGFCIFNDVADAIRILQSENLIDRALVLDLDVHQGDGTATIFADDPSVFTFSMHCSSNFPLRKRKSDRDIGLPRGTGDEKYLAVLRVELDSIISKWRPDIVFYNAGVDSHMEDKLGLLALTDNGIADRDLMVLSTCHSESIPIAAVVGGGYSDDIDQLAHLSLIHISEPTRPY